jgi:hypothetical protein
VLRRKYQGSNVLLHSYSQQEMNWGIFVRKEQGGNKDSEILKEGRTERREVGR